MRATYIINPFSAHKKYKSFLKVLKQKCPNAQYLVSKSVEDTHNYIKNTFENTDIYVAVGGDGTISTIAQKLINTDKILAVFPAGSGNGFARENHFSKSIDELLNKIDKEQIHKIDTFTVNGNLSINVSGVGFDGMIVERFEKTNRGLINYIKVTIKTFFAYKSIDVEFEEKHKQHNGQYLMVNLANTKQFGNNAFIAPQADFSDGLVDVVLVKKFPLSYSIKFAYHLFTKGLKKSKYLNYFPTSEVKFNVKNSNKWHLDGEAKIINSPVEVKVLPSSLNILS